MWPGNGGALLTRLSHGDTGQALSRTRTVRGERLKMLEIEARCSFKQPSNNWPPLPGYGYCTTRHILYRSQTSSLAMLCRLVASGRTKCRNIAWKSSENSLLRSGSSVQCTYTIYIYINARLFERILFFKRGKGKKRAAASLCNDSVDLFRNKAQDCPGGRRRYHCNAGIYERQFQLRGVKTPRHFM